MDINLKSKKMKTVYNRKEDMVNMESVIKFKQAFDNICNNLNFTGKINISIR